MDVILLLVRAQNVGLILRSSPVSFTFEYFELTPRLEVVLTRHGGLVRSFPETAVGIPHAIFKDAKFQIELASKLEKLDTEVVQEMIFQMKESGSYRVSLGDVALPRACYGDANGHLGFPGRTYEITPNNKASQR